MTELKSSSAAQPIEGFDLGNSPLDYTPDRVFGQTVLFTTTNGTKALAHARLAKRTLIGAAINRQAIVDAVADSPRVDILCAGTNGKVTREDILAAGAIASQLQALHKNCTTNEWIDAACREWQELLTTACALNRTPSKQFAHELRDTLGGKNLLALGYDDDLPFCAQLDTHNVAPELDHTTGQIKLP
ncbi:MAG: 2-phosphosulfolactate phosphatase [Planctomycetes bacterium]|nr:2-phosphosulfolactate phosphatase [Planctomycetota bacterium]